MSGLREIVGAIAIGLAIGAGLRFAWDTWLQRDEPGQEAQEAALPTDAPLANAVALTVAEWTRWNPWYQKDPILQLEAQTIHLQLQQTNPGQPLAENLADVTLEMRRRHPEIMTLN